VEAVCINVAWKFVWRLCVKAMCVHVWRIRFEAVYRGCAEAVWKLHGGCVEAVCVELSGGYVVVWLLETVCVCVRGDCVYVFVWRLFMEAVCRAVCVCVYRLRLCVDTVCEACVKAVFRHCVISAWRLCKGCVSRRTVYGRCVWRLCVNTVWRDVCETVCRGSV